MIKKSLVATAGALCLVLGACSDEPSSAAMGQSFRNVFGRMPPPQVAVTNLQLGGKPDGKVDDPTEITDFRKIGCTSTSSKGYSCEFTVTLNGIVRPKMKVNFERGADGKLLLED